jgi:hypothetical protein
MEAGQKLVIATGHRSLLAEGANLIRFVEAEQAKEDKVIQDPVFMDSDDSNGICSLAYSGYPRNTIYLLLRGSFDWNTCLVSGCVA